VAFVSRYGNTISENGWRMCDQAECEWVEPCPGVTIQLRKGIPATILGAFAARFNATVEKLRDADTAGWTPTNDVPTSNHMAGTAMDLDWGSHPFHAVGTFGPRLPALRRLLDDFEGCVWWGGDWDSPKDEMHFQLNYGEGDPRLEALAQKLQGAVPKPPPPQDKTHVYARAVIEEGQKRGISRKGICIALTVPPVESGWKMYANANVPASMALPHDAVGFDHDSVGLFQQRQAWGPIEVLMDPHGSAGLFYDGGAQGQRGLVDFDYNSDDEEPGEYAANVQCPAAQYRYRYQEHWDDANALYDEIVGTQEDDGFMSALTAEEQRAMYNAVMGPRPSRSPLRHVGEGMVGNILDLEWNVDGSVHVLVIWLLAAYLKSPEALALLVEVANNADPARQEDRKLAQAMLNKIDMMDSGIGCPVADSPASAAPVVTETVPATRPVPPAPESSGLSSELTQLRDTIHSLTDILNRLK
jgi:hypothetical protein